MHTLVIGNTHDNPTAVAQIAGAGDYCMLNEVRGGATPGLKRAGFASYHPSGAAHQNAHMWRINKLEVHATTSRTIMVGGRRGLTDARVSPRVKRRFRGKRLGPSRGASACYIEEIGGGFGIYVNAHLVARAFTSERWRRPLHYASVLSLVLMLRGLEKAHPGVPIIVGGDGNSNGRWSGMPSRYVRMNTLPDMGRSHYTQLYVNHNGGRADITNVREQRNVSDHDAVIATVHFRSKA